MSARDWQPGDKANVEVEVEDVTRMSGVDTAFVWVQSTRPGLGRSVGVRVPAADLLPVPQADEGAIERAAEVIWHSDHLERAVLADARVIARALAAANLLASPVQPSCDTCRDEKRVTTMVPGFTGEPVEGEVDCPDCVAIRPAYPPRQPGRSEAEIKAEALNEAADEFDLIWNRGHDRSVHPDSHILRARAARVADTTDTEGGE